MSGINKVIILGRLGKDPEVRQVGEGNSVCKLAIATSENWIDKSGTKQEKTDWHNIVVWGKLAEICGKYLSKGRQLYVEGKLQTRSWEDQQGQKRYTTEIVANTVEFIGSNTGAGAGASSDRSQNGSSPDFGPEPLFNTNEELPF
jgi:single-strand DNA-binding protein